LKFKNVYLFLFEMIYMISCFNTFGENKVCCFFIVYILFLFFGDFQ